MVLALHRPRSKAYRDPARFVLSLGWATNFLNEAGLAPALRTEGDMTVVVRTDSARDPKGKGILCRLLACALGITTAPCIAAEGTSRASGDWTMPAHDYASTRYSELADIDTSN